MEKEACGNKKAEQEVQHLLEQVDSATRARSAAMDEKTSMAVRVQVSRTPRALCSICEQFQMRYGTPSHRSACTSDAYMGGFSKTEG